MENGIAFVATAVGVGAAARGIWRAKAGAPSRVDDSPNFQYRALVRERPLAAMLGRRLSGVQLMEALRSFNRSLDLSSEQAFLAGKPGFFHDASIDEFCGLATIRQLRAGVTHASP